MTLNSFGHCDYGRTVRKNFEHLKKDGLIQILASYTTPFPLVLRSHHLEIDVDC